MLFCKEEFCEDVLSSEGDGEIINGKLAWKVVDMELVARSV
jgi:hypothetical protein